MVTQLVWQLLEITQLVWQLLRITQLVRQLLEITQLVFQLMWHLLAIMPGVSSAQDCSLICQLMWHLLAMMSGVLSAHDYSNGVSADLFANLCDNCSRLLNWCFSWWSVCLPWCPVWHLLKITQLVCQLMWLAKMAGLTTAQDCSSGVNTSQVTQLVCQLMWSLFTIVPGLPSAQDYSTGASADVVSTCHDVWCVNCVRLLH